MLKPSVGVATEGVPYIVIAAFSTLIFAIIGFWPIAILGLGATCLVGHVFRDPDRISPEDADAVSAPADGKVVAIDQEDDPASGELRTVVRIATNFLDVPVNRMPVSGKVELIRYTAGKMCSVSAKDAERNLLVITGKGNQRFSLVQRGGLCNGRVVCLAESGDKFKRGERFGLIKFGSRVDLYIPDGYEAVVEAGARVAAGQTVLAEKRKA